MGKRILLGALICGLLLFLSAGAFAQESAVKGNLGGVVLDSTGAVVPGAKVTLTGPTGTVTVNSDNQGNFMFTRLNPGLYSVRVESKGFKASDVKGVEVFVGRTSSVRMELAPGAATETVEVTANAITVDTTSTASGANLSDSFYASVPVPRNVSGLFYVAPGVADSGGAGRANPSISGGSGLENLYVADGVNITDPAFGGLGIFTRQYGSVGTGINLSFIKEVQVKSGGFEPQYGGTTGGVVQIVTKSGSDTFHGTLAGFFAPVNTAATARNVDDFHNRHFGSDFFTSNSGSGAPQSALGVGPGSYDIDAEIGGYIPHFRDKLFFFGSYNPTLNTDYISPPLTPGSQTFFNSVFANAGIDPNTPVPQLGLAKLFNGRPIYTRAWVNNYAGKLTYRLNDKHTIETSVFGDPTSTNNSAFRAVAADNTSVFSKQQYQTRNWVARWNGTISPTWLVNANFTWNHNEFTETPQDPNVFHVVDLTLSGISPTLQGLGFLENHNADNFGYALDTTKTVKFLGSHTFTLGGNEGFLNYDETKDRTGGLFPVPDVGAFRDNLIYGCSAPTGDVTCPLGFLTNAEFRLRPSLSCTLCPLYPTVTGLVPVSLQINRGEYGPPFVNTEGLSISLYGNDSWTVNKYLTLNFGLRWEQYRMSGTAEKYTFTDNWAPRLGLAWDPLGDRKSKFYVNWARYNYQMPLDAAIRSLSNELDLLSLRFAPASTGGLVNINPDGSIQIIPDAAHLLNNPKDPNTNTDSFPGGVGGAAFVSSQAGPPGTTGLAANIEGFAPGTKMQYEDEYVGGFEHEFSGGLVFSARYIDRRLRRVVEDMGGISPEAADLGVTQIFQIGNPGPKLDLFTNEPVPIVQPFGGTCPGGTVVSDTDANGFPFASGLQACFPASILDPTSTAGIAKPDGIPDGFAQPVRNYQALELEANKGFSSGWLMRLNYRYARLRGNYEGAFRNDNGQTDPSISSLFDFTTGKLNLLGDQFAVGPLNTERHHVGNFFFSYSFSQSMLKGLTLGTGMRIQSGTPISELGNHPAYGNAGEVPFGGRGRFGRTTPNGQIDLHGEYARKMTERFTMRVGADLFNITNSKQLSLRDQNRDISFAAPGSNTAVDITGVPGANDFLAPLAFQNPFYSRFSVKLEF